MLIQYASLLFAVIAGASTITATMAYITKRHQPWQNLHPSVRSSYDVAAGAPVIAAIAVASINARTMERHRPVSQAAQTNVTVQTYRDLPTIRLAVEGRPNTEFLLQTASVPSNVNSYRQMTEQMLQEPSAMGTTHEGVVIRTAGSFTNRQFAESVCKVVRAGHVPPDEDHWSHNWTPARLLRAGGTVG